MRMLSLRLLFPLLAIVLAITVLAAYTHHDEGGGIDYPETLPGGYHVARLATGSEAVEMIRGLHWSPEKIDVDDALVAIYTDGTILWASYVDSNACPIAASMAEKMREYETELPYTAPIPHSFGDTLVYLTMNKHDGSLHAFWCRDGLVVWVRLGAAGARDPVGLLELFIEEVKKG
ncbi:hypothetical protein [Hyperthermus butylicus]|uniref:Uncharacterized protein n=1 Tax=Hyperthermus butylicus (strain DSM 5456 / JCM 9403 / PLM1-5) TaxID=415426 RepID=A2BJA6_HYPBU|nr:hypothetical protein [Hyperthermus butylicus]ABM80067.1 hypothetical protein Hbut_0195 [Hyperthermus butylicus DSM 5456]